MYKRLLQAASTAALVLGSSLAVAGSVSFTVQNETGYTLTGLYGGPSSEDNWGGNILRGRIPPGGEMEVTITDARTCEWDFRYEFSDQDSYEEYEVDVCDIDGDVFTIE